jgi:hypothetical protein
VITGLDSNRTPPECKPRTLPLYERRVTVSRIRRKWILSCKMLCNGQERLFSQAINRRTKDPYKNETSKCLSLHQLTNPKRRCVSHKQHAALLEENRGGTALPDGAAIGVCFSKPQCIIVSFLGHLNCSFPDMGRRRGGALHAQWRDHKQHATHEIIANCEPNSSRVKPEALHLVTAVNTMKAYSYSASWSWNSPLL